MRLPCLMLAAFLLAGCTSSAPAARPVGAPGGGCADPCGTILDHGTRWEPSVAVDPRDPKHLVASSEDQQQNADGRAVTSWGVASVSFDGGASWESRRMPGGPGAAPTEPLFGYQLMDDSVVTILSEGTVLWGALVIRDPVTGGAATPAALVVLRSHDGGRTFGEPNLVQDGGGVEGVPLAYDFQDKEWFAQGPDGTILLVWNSNMAASADCPNLGGCTFVYFSVSRDGGVTWSPRAIVEKEAVASGAFPVIMPDGAWIVSWRDTGRHEARVSISRDRGISWKTQTLDKSTKFPVMALSGARLWIAYPRSDAPTIDGPQVPVARFSDDGGATWSDARELDAPVRDGRTIPGIAAGPNGSAFVTFWRVLPDATAQLRWVNVDAERAPIEGTLDATSAATKFVGDYMGLAPLPDGSAYAVWDARHADGPVLAGARIR